MIQSKVFLVVLLILLLLFIIIKPVVATELEISANQLFFFPQSGQWWKMRIQSVHARNLFGVSTD